MQDELTYNKLRGHVKNPLQLRMALVQYALEQGIKPAARSFGTSPQTVRFWLKRYQDLGLLGLKERSHQPLQAHPNTTPVEVEAKVVALRTEQPRYGQDRIAALLTASGSPISGKTVGKILKRHGLMKSALPNAKQSNSDRGLSRHALHPFEHLQVDVIDLSVFRTPYQKSRKGCLPRYEFVLRDVSSGASFIAYAHTLEPHNIRCFIQRVLAHLQKFGLKPQQLHMVEQSAWAVNQLDWALTPLLQSYGVTPNLLPPQSTPRSWSVRAFQQTIEEEFYKDLSFDDETDLLKQAGGFGQWFNLERTDKHRKQSPLKAARRKEPNLLPQALLLDPVQLDTCDCSG